MIQKLSAQITDFSIRQGVVNESERETFVYCFELLFNGCITTSIIICISLFTNMFIETLFWGLGFWPLRVYAGGYHATSHEKCLTLTLLVYCLSLMAIFFYKSYTLFSLLLPIVFSIIVVYLFAPISNENKPLSLGKCIILRKKSRTVVCLNFVIILFGFYLLPNSSYILSILCGQFVATTSIILEVIKTKNRRGINDEEYF